MFTRIILLIIVIFAPVQLNARDFFRDAEIDGMGVDGFNPCRRGIKDSQVRFYGRVDAVETTEPPSVQYYGGYYPRRYYLPPYQQQKRKSAGTAITGDCERANK